MALIAMDFDHTLVELDTALPGAREAINILRERGHKILIHSCNSVDWIKKVLDNNDIRYDGIYEGKKPLADMYVDDKGFRFTGNWSTDVDDILDHLEGFDNRKWTR